MSHFVLYKRTKREMRLRYLALGAVCILAAGLVGMGLHSIGMARAKSREVIPIYTEEELSRYLLDKESEDYNRNGRYRLEEDLELDWLEESIGTNIEPFTGKFDGNGHVISGLTRPLFGVLEHAEVERLFLSEASIENPFTYYDGERYVDGYGALAAYAVDSSIRNCGMGGEIHTASPVEAEYQIEKGSLSDADMWKGPGVQETVELEETDRNMEEAGPGVSYEENDESESSISVPSNDNDPEEGQPEIAGPETEQTESSVSETEAGSPEIELPETSAGDGVDTSKSESENIESETSEIENGTVETVEPEHESTEAGASEGDAEESKAEIKESESEAESETKPESEVKPEGGSLVTNEQDTLRTSETVGYQKHDRQYLTLKVSAVVDFDEETSPLASPSDADIPDATPSNAEDVSDATSDAESAGNDAGEGETEYIGNPNGDIYILVSAERVMAGGLIAQTAGDTLISDSFVLVTIESQLKTIDTYVGGLAGILGDETRTENSYAAGLTDGDDVTGGLAAVNEGQIENCYSTVTIGAAGRSRGPFTAFNEGSLSGCVYDRQLACIGVEEEVTPGVMGLNTSQMTGMEHTLTGNWYVAERAYPQLEVFAQSENETVRSYSRASVIALDLPEGTMLLDVFGEDDIVLPSEVDGEAIQWDAAGDADIDENNQVRINTGARIFSHDVPRVETSLEHAGTESEVSEEAGTEETASVNGKDARAIQLKGTVGSATRNFAITAQAAVPAAASYQSWDGVGAELYQAGSTLPGSGTSADPYLIGTAEELALYAYLVNSVDRGVCGKLTENIDLFGASYVNVNPEDATIDNIDRALCWRPIGWSSKMFQGIFDGDGHTVSNLKVVMLTGPGWNLPEGFGLFGWCDGGAIKNVGVSSGRITVPMRAAGVVGRIAGNVTITNCWNNATIEGSTTVDDSSVFGGIVGYILTGSVKIEHCYNTGTITAAANYAGGILGHKYGEQRASVTIIDCYNLGSVSGKQGVGGIFGMQEGTGSVVQNCFNVGNITGDGNVGSIIGYNSVGPDSIQNCYYDKETSLVLDATAKALSTTQMQSWGAAYALNGGKMDGPWEFIAGDYPRFGTLQPANWKLVGEALEYDLLGSSYAKPSGIGTADDPFQIGNAVQFGWYAYKINSETANRGLCADLTNDIRDFVGAEWGGTPDQPIVWTPIQSFKGTFGAGHPRPYELEGMRIVGVRDIGVFGNLSENASVSRIGVVSSYLEGGANNPGNEDCMGAICGAMSKNAIVNQCYGKDNKFNLVGEALLTAAIGGIVGELDVNAVIQDCYNQFHAASDITISGTYTKFYVAGICGDLYYTNEAFPVRNCYSVCKNGGSFQAPDGIKQINQKIGDIGAYTKRSGMFRNSCSDGVFSGKRQVSDVIFTDMKSHKPLAYLNNLEVGDFSETLRTGADRVWYSSLDAEGTEGYPTLIAPETVSVTFSPETPDGGSTVNLPGNLSVPSMKLRAFEVTDSLFTPGATGESLTLVSSTAISGAGSGYYQYGTTNANQKLGFKAGSTDLYGKAASLNNPTVDLGTVNSITLYAAAAYIKPENRYILLEASSGTTRYEVQITVEGSKGKTLSAKLPVKVGIVLEPAVEQESYSADLELENKNHYPINASITTVVKQADKGLQLSLVSSDVDVGMGNARLGITSPASGSDTGNLGGGKHYYKPAAGSTPESWFSCKIGAGTAFRYRYFMEHAVLYYDTAQNFGYDVTYQLKVSDKDAGSEVVVS